jgi:hypothetical protein
VLRVAAVLGRCIARIRQPPALPPQALSDRQWLDRAPIPPLALGAFHVEIVVVERTQGHGKLIADFPAEGARLRDAQVVGL